jgi:AbrB family looped-hinge helix DNA binding protein
VADIRERCLRNNTLAHGRSPANDDIRLCANQKTSRFKLRSLDDFDVRRYLTTMTTTVSTKGQIVLPAELRLQDDIEPGQEFEVQRIDRGEYRLVRRKPPANEGLVDWLLACPEKNFFTQIESESTDTL